jgi:predicted nucleotidyltransferase
MRKAKKKTRSQSFERRAAAPRVAANQRTLVAQHAARIMHEQGVHDYLTAKRKAAERLGIEDRAALPSNSEIEEALAEHQRLFAGPAHGESLKALRRAARRAMQLFDDFEPRLVGSVLSGTASAHSDINLHLFADSSEQVAFRLIRDEIPYRLSERRVRVGTDRYEVYPVYKFFAGDAPVDATVFPLDGLRQAPFGPVDGKPIRRARREELDAMIEESGGSRELF